MSATIAAENKPVLTPERREAPPTVCPTLAKILAWKRPHETTSEIIFCEWLFGEITARGGAPTRMSTEDCIVVTLRAAGASVDPTTLFSCHVDTVHEKGGAKQEVLYDAAFGHIFQNKNCPAAGNCLGADDGAGVWLMLEMIREQVPGTYVFHRGEERGGLGSRTMLAQHAKWLRGFDIAVAFDRQDTFEVITHQGGTRCASDKFGGALSARLNALGMAYSPSTLGVFTDTKIYREVIAECVNIGVGYHHQHTNKEYLDYGHLVALRDAVIALNWDSLPVDRDPLEEALKPKQAGTYGEEYSYSKYPRSVPKYNGSGLPFSSGLTDDEPSLFPGPVVKPAAKQAVKPASVPTQPAPSGKDEPYLDASDEMVGYSLYDLEDICTSDSKLAATLFADLLSEIQGLRARLRYYQTLNKET